MTPPSDDVRASGEDDPEEDDTSTGRLPRASSGPRTEKDPDFHPAIRNASLQGDFKSTLLSSGQAPQQKPDLRSTQLSAGQEPNRPILAVGLGPMDSVLPKLSDDETDSTVTQPRAASPPNAAPLEIPGSIEINDPESRNAEEPLDETEVRTLPGSSTIEASTSRVVATPSLAEESPRPAAGRAAAADPSVMRASSPDDPPTTEIDRPTARRHDADIALRANDDPASITARGPNADLPIESEEESVTTSAPALPLAPVRPAALGLFPDAEEESVTTSAPALPFAPARPAAGAPFPADTGDDSESVTTRASGRLVNMLRVITAEDGSESPPIEDSEPLQNQTVVMANAPVRPDQLGLSSSSPIAPPQPPPKENGGASESALRIVPSVNPSGERASLQVLGVQDQSLSFSGPHGTPGSSFVVLPPLGFPESAKKPPYAAIAIVVLAASIAIPALVYVSLHEPSDPGPARRAASASPEVNPRTGETARPKAKAWTPTVASGSSSAKPTGNPPLRR